MPTTIQISDKVKLVLDKMKMIERETYNEIIERMIEDDTDVNERTKKELEERRKSKDFISHEDVKKRYGL
jgi:predicted kinase